jgi:hypothetical protein
MAKNRGKKDSVKDSIIATTTMPKKFWRFSDNISLTASPYYSDQGYGFYFSQKTEIYKSSDKFHDFGFSVTATGHNYIVEITLTNTGSKDVKISRYGLSGFQTLDQVDFVLKPNVPTKLNVQSNANYNVYGGQNMYGGYQIRGGIQTKRNSLEYFIEVDGLFVIIVIFSVFKVTLMKTSSFESTKVGTVFY